ncbi:hypothetical protein MRX96_049349 [Rhipicephalus microplus]
MVGENSATSRSALATLIQPGGEKGTVPVLRARSTSRCGRRERKRQTKNGTPPHSLGAVLCQVCSERGRGGGGGTVPPTARFRRRMSLALSGLSHTLFDNRCTR